MAKPLKWHTEKRKVKDLIAWERNPREMTPQQAEDLQDSIEKFNLMPIPVINTNNLLISGHQRVNILKLLKRGDEVIDVRVPNRSLTDKEVQSFLNTMVLKYFELNGRFICDRMIF